MLLPQLFSLRWYCPYLCCHYLSREEHCGFLLETQNYQNYLSNTAAAKPPCCHSLRRWILKKHLKINVGHDIELQETCLYYFELTGISTIGVAVGLLKTANLHRHVNAFLDWAKNRSHRNLIWLGYNWLLRSTWYVVDLCGCRNARHAGIKLGRGWLYGLAKIGTSERYLGFPCSCLHVWTKGPRIGMLGT